jgi:Fe-S cluster biogenesis protein NfuA/nitrite reductase/ring-hydroxylating ferredoxin subunit
MAIDPAQRRVTVLDLMAEASASVPDSGAAMRRPGESVPQPKDYFVDQVDDPDRGKVPVEDMDALLERIEELSEALEEVRDSNARAVAEELMAATLELHGNGLARVMELVDEAGPEAAPLREWLVQDGIVASLLLVHGLYPVDLETRVMEALAEVRPYMESHGGDVELVSLEGGVAKLKLHGSCEGCPASQATLEMAVKKALMETAPDLAGMEVEGVEEPDPEPADIGGTPLPLAPEPNGGGAGPAAPKVPSVSEWRELPGAADVPEGVAVELGGLLVANLNGTLLAYNDACSACGGPLHGGELDDDGVLSCPGCGKAFDLPKAGRPLEAGVPQLGPVPLLRESDGRVRVALPA